MRRRSTRGARGPFGVGRRSRLSKALLAARTLVWLGWRLGAIAVGELRSRGDRR